VLWIWSDIAIAISALTAGAVAAVTGFGIGSLLTPVFALQVDTRLAVAAVSVPHVIGTAVRFAMLKEGPDHRVLWTFGLTSAAGGLTGALLQGRAESRWLTVLFGALLLFAAGAELTGLGRRMRFRGRGAWIAGGFSGLLGGLVGNQGGIRSAALLAFDLPKHSFIATATAIALFVDGARVPVYLATQRAQMLGLRSSIAVATAGVVIGTLVGSRVLTRMPEFWFRRTLAAILIVLGVSMIVR
jgi:uncharacterized membrane protein YfcA